jgi:hypothetical protein
MTNEMPDVTRELLQAHHEAVLRELDKINIGVATVASRTNELEHRVGILTWAYGLAAAILMAGLAKIGWGGHP